MTTWRDLYPTGRKHCSLCGRWRHVRDFHVREWVDIERTVPRRLQSRCGVCEAGRLRAKRGYKPRNWYPCGDPRNPSYKKRRTAKKKVRYHELKRDSDWLAQRREYDRIRAEASRRQQGIQPRPLSRRAPGVNEGLLDGKRLGQYLDRFMHSEKDERGQIETRLNGVVIIPPDQRLLSHLRHGTQKKVSLDVADRLAVTYDFQLWEFEEVAGAAGP